MLLLQPAAGQQIPSLGQLQQQLGAQNQNQGQVGQQALEPVIIQPVTPAVARALPPSRLEQIMSRRAGSQLQQFGYDQLGHGSPMVVPQTGAVQDSYILGPGDEVVVSLRGQENGEYRAIVDRNGQIVLPRLSPIAASGRSFGSFRDDVDAAVHRAYVATAASVTVGRMRQISVLVSGEVNAPGQRLVTGLSSVVDAVMLSGGIKKTGSLRNVRIERKGRLITVDLYTVLATGGGGSTMPLADGDRILVPPLGRTVAVTGLVRRPGIFEMAPGQAAISVKSLMALAGGEEVRGRYRYSVLRITMQGVSDMEQLASKAGQLQDSDILFVQLNADQTTSQASLSGPTGLAGAYPVITGTKLSEVIKAPGAMGASPYTAFGIIVRKDPATLMPLLMAFTPAAVLGGREDQPLQANDVIRVLSTNEIQMLNFIVGAYLDGLSNQQEAIRHPLSQKNDAQNSLANLVQARSGQSPRESDISTVPANVQREEINGLLDTAAPGSSLAQQRTEQALAAQRASQQAAAAQTQTLTGAAASRPGVTASQMPVVQPQVPGAEIEPLTASPVPASQAASVMSPQGETPRNFTDAAVDNNGYAGNREVQTFGQLARQLNIDPLILVNFLVDSRVRLDGAVRGPGYYFAGPGTSLAELVQAAGGTINWADESGVELISTAVDRQTGRSTTQRVSLPLHQGTLASYVVRPGDQIRFGQVFTNVGIGSVTVQGEVRFPGTFIITRGDHLSDLMARAGGLTNVAYPYGTVYLRQSVAQLEREGYIRAANEVQNQLVIAMTRIGNDKIEPTTFASMQTFVQELRNQQAVGRISIVADPSVLAADPSQDPLLEAGDVIYVPQRPSTVSVLGQVLQPGSYPYKAGETVHDYIQRAGNYASTADESQTFVVLPDGSARRLENSWLSFHDEKLPPGSSIVVPRDVTPLDLRQSIIDVSTILSQLAVSIASVAVLSRQ